MAGDPPCGCGMVWPYPSSYQPPNPRVLAVNVPFPDFGVTVVTMDDDGNVTIKRNQPRPAESETR